MQCPLTFSCLPRLPPRCKARVLELGFTQLRALEQNP
uniref:Peroxidase n=1 Tax=Rhizophora mucronata TaxID=61149 RepID=A0A2P2IRR1_RHIMU